jgi:SpoVK/Ycf46/Vps4 family AAA+-type ATPase
MSVGKCTEPVAKRRDDSSEVGELKRLVTVFLQEIDDWPATGLLIAATNHADLLDPVVWRRFEMRYRIPDADRAIRTPSVETFLGKDRASSTWNDVLAVALRGLSFSGPLAQVMSSPKPWRTRQRAGANWGEVKVPAESGGLQSDDDTPT